MRDFYDSPISILTEQLSNQLAFELDNTVYKTVLPYCVDVDKNKLIQALTQDAERYREAYKKGYFDAKKKGKWIEYPESLEYEDVYCDDQIVCSNCHHVFNIIDNCTEEFDYCPHCGADMTEETI